MPPRKRLQEFSDSDDFSSEDTDFDEDDQDMLDLDMTTTNTKLNTGPSKAKGKGKDKEDKSKGKDNGYSWEASFERSWDVVQEDESGSLEGAVETLMARGRRRRLQDSRPVRRTIIRHLIILLDLSDTMSEKDLRPSRFDLTLEYVKEFVSEWFDQNPLGQIGIIALRSGIAERLTEMGGNSQEILRILQDKKKLEPAGEPSLQNGLEMARGSMNHLPAHSSREVLLLLSSLTSCDPGSVSQTITSLQSSKIRVSVVCLAAETKLSRELSTKTGGSYGVALNEGHLKDLMWEEIPPPALTSSATTDSKGKAGTSGGGGSDLMMMGFPTKLPDSGPASLCACHSSAQVFKPEGFLCPRCGAKLCEVPTDCEVCGLLVVSSPHLARSYHHLFPVSAWKPVLIPEDLLSLAPTCSGCSLPFPPVNLEAKRTAVGGKEEAALSPTGRYKCEKCSGEFCAECDAFVHEVLHVCPGCG
ncbi:tfiih basal transcription factor subunit ssl1 [Phaffia rhodozyma]|uniref:General transcription and DNA repair factor IIH n=1 Tax=Phaffia rhodozyma TaxID=264483 RepID=A0A0F7SUG9_PHARH|nr:tfiih basal transcription factor subunit ssl1 [Phaffia rhodozyma]